MTKIRGLLHDPVTGASRQVEGEWLPGASGGLRLDGDPTVVPAEQLSVSGGGWGESAVHLSWAEADRTWALTVSAPAVLQDLSAVLPAPLAEAVRGQCLRSRRQHRRGRLALALVLGLVALPVVAILALFLLRDRIVDAVVRRLPYSVDQQIGDSMFQQLAAPGGRLVREGPCAEATRRIGERLSKGLATSPFPFRFVVVRDESVNAFAAPGGLIAVHTGLLASAATPDEVAGVLGHEMIHTLERHSLRQLLFEAGLLVSAQLLLGSPQGGADILAGTALQLGGLRFSRDQERDADAGGLKLLEVARVSPEGFAHFLDRLAEQHGVTPPALLSTHPESKERGQALRAEIARRGPWPVEPLGDLDWEAVRAQAKGGGRAARGSAELRAPRV